MRLSPRLLSSSHSPSQGLAPPSSGVSYTSGGHRVSLKSDFFNAIITALGGNPVVFLQTPGLNTIAMIVIMIWLQTGFAMVILSAAIKGVPDEHLEAARIDGATELQVFFRIIIPSIRGSIITVATTIFIAVLKVFDIVYVLTGGNFESQVLANSMFEQMFRFRNLGFASAIAMALLIVVTPVIIINVRNLRRQGIGA